jgi:hypothetical protein
LDIWIFGYLNIWIFEYLHISRNAAILNNMHFVRKMFHRTEMRMKGAKDF